MANFTLTVNGATLDITDADDCNTVDAVIALFRDSQNIPANPVAVVDGEPVTDFSAEIPDGSEVALNRPSGEKG